MPTNFAVDSRPRARLTGDTILVGIDVGSTTVKAVLADARAKRELDDLEAAFASYLEEDTVVPAGVTEMDQARLDIAPLPPEIKTLVFHRTAPLEITP